MPSRYDWGVIVLRVKKLKQLRYVDMAAEMECDESTVRNWVYEISTPQFDHGEWLRTAYEPVYGALPLKRVTSPGKG